MSEHTPGPWVIEPGKPLMVVARDGGFAVILSEVGKKITPSDKANARLIAAAPDLIAILVSLVSYVGQLELLCYDKSDVSCEHPTVTAALEVIAKVGGQYLAKGAKA